jgi:glutamine amidotransferase-like uncharacterized protein
MRNVMTSVVLAVVAAIGGVATAAEAPAIRVAIYDDGGGGGAGPGNVEKCLGKEVEGFKYRRVGAEDIRKGVLKGVDVLVQPGGSGSKQAEALQVEGREASREFVNGGGGYVGICAGSYLATTDYTWSLGILNAKVLDRKHWARGTGDVRIKMTGAGREMMGAADEMVTVYYGQGPLLAPDTKEGLPAYETLAVYETEVTKKGVPGGVMKGTTAIAAAAFGEGRVICLSPHPERTKGLDGFIRRAVNWAAKKETTAAAK